MKKFTEDEEDNGIDALDSIEFRSPSVRNSVICERDHRVVYLIILMYFSSC